MIDIREIRAIADDPRNFVYDMFEYLEEKCANGRRPEALNEHERVIYLTLDTQFLIENSGFEAIFDRTPYVPLQDVQEAFTAIGAHRAAELCGEAASLCCEDDRDYSALDDEFCALEDELRGLNYAYILNRETYFQ